jgi:exopolysaccharide biosynthesis polyprenyl glycosylphosphotransferase
VEIVSSAQVTGAFGPAQRPAPPIDQPDTGPAVAVDPDDPWLSLLATASRVGVGRIAYGFVVKRWIDLVVASLGLVVLAPLLLVVALAVRLDSTGPVVFRQRRIGQGGRPFVMYKFRTMVVDDDTTLRLFRDDQGRWRHKVADDPRVTRVGRFLRRTSLDELPQLLNVLRGEMSFVGPRPELPQIVRGYEPWQHLRHVVRPGITGWWQTHGRSEYAMHEHTELDIYYVRHLSLRLDVRIVARTVRTVLGGLGAF